MTDHTISAAADTDPPLTTEEIHKLLRRTLLACATIIAFVVLVEAASANVY